AMVREICDRHGVLLIYDEVMSCVGRAGKFLAAQYWPQSRPDIVALAKGLGGGYTPLGALLTSAALVDEVRAAGGFAHGHTYAANPMSCAIGCAVVDEVIERDLIGNSARMGRVLRESLESLKATCPLVGDVRGRGLQLAVEIVADQVSKRPLPPESRGVERLREWCIEHGLVLLTRRTSGGRFGEWLMIGPPLIVTEPQIEEVVNAFARGLRSFQEELTRAGLVRLG
ncbi:MAG TPA: aminotransferase class III-fold pyridoxal phosphate-dependent enzyme, partial [Steroidobacteraceae bacterium]|nr:aminotransferase class III-fold pyridoxal phosphate-dependent enzyme [Steroidobacteraceae bacterium]